MQDDEIEAFVKERNEVLLSGNVDRVMSFHLKYNPDIPFPNREVAEIAMHKGRTAALGLPIEARLESKRWLSERGYSSMDDGNLVN